MREQFLNEPADCQWLRETALKRVGNLPPFAAFVLIGNEDSPEELRLYDNSDPTVYDSFIRFVMDETGNYSERSA